MKFKNKFSLTVIRKLTYQQRNPNNSSVKIIIKIKFRVMDHPNNILKIALEYSQVVKIALNLIPTLYKIIKNNNQIKQKSPILQMHILVPFLKIFRHARKHSKNINYNNKHKKYLLNNNNWQENNKFRKKTLTMEEKSWKKSLTVLSIKI